MALRIDENLLSDAAREYLNNSKSKAKAARRAIEFFVNFNSRVASGSGGVDLYSIDALNKKLDFLLKYMQSLFNLLSDIKYSSIESLNNNLLNDNKAESDNISVEVQKRPPDKIHNKVNKNSISVDDTIPVNDKDNEEEYIKLALSSIKNILNI